MKVWDAAARDIEHDAAPREIGIIADGEARQPAAIFAEPLMGIAAIRAARTGNPESMMAMLSSRVATRNPRSLRIKSAAAAIPCSASTRGTKVVVASSNPSATIYAIVLNAVHAIAKTP